MRTSSDGAEALRAIDLEPPDSMVLDLILPGMSGFAVLETVRGFGFGYRFRAG